MANSPTVTVQAATLVDGVVATLNGNITVADSGGNATVRGFNYGLTTGYGSVASESGSFGVGAFSQLLSGLGLSTTYHYQAFAVGPTGTAVSADATFTTSASGRVTISADGPAGRYAVFDNSWPANPHRKMGSYESLRDAQKSLLSASDQARLDMGTPFSALSSVQVV
jgi:hypothetical protein